MKSFFATSSTMVAYLLWIGVASQLFFSIPSCSGAPMITTTPTAKTARVLPASGLVKVQLHDPTDPVMEEVEKMVEQLKLVAVIADQVDRDRQTIPPLNCTINIRPASSAPSWSSGESPDLWDQLRNLLINMSIWSITIIFGLFRELFNLFFGLVIWLMLLIFFLMFLGALASAANEYIKDQQAAAASKKKTTGNGPQAPAPHPPQVPNAAKADTVV